MADVRSILGVPTLKDFNSTSGSPLLWDAVAKRAYLLAADNTVVAIDAYPIAQAAGSLATHAALTTTAHGGIVPSTRKITASIDLSADRNLGAADVGADAAGAAAAAQAAAIAASQPVDADLTAIAALSTTTYGRAFLALADAAAARTAAGLGTMAVKDIGTSTTVTTASLVGKTLTFTDGICVSFT